MFKFKKGIILKNICIICKEGEDYTDLFKKIGLKDNQETLKEKVVKVKMLPNLNYLNDVEKWYVYTDQYIYPDWYLQESKKYLNMFKKHIRNNYYIKKEKVDIERIYYKK